MKQCSKCILTEHAVPIGDDGLCLYCRTDDGVVRVLGEEALIQTLQRHRRAARDRGASFDCIVPVSGGRDSMYALYALVKRYDMRCLAFNYSQGYVEPQAIENLENGVRALGVDLVRSTNNRTQHRYLRHNLAALCKARPQQRRLVELICAGCDTGYVDAADELAKQHKISLIVQGGCGFEPFLRGYLTSDVRMIAKNGTISLMAEEIKEFFGNLDLFIDPRYPLNRRYFCHIENFLRRRLPVRPRPPEIERIHFFNYIPWQYRSHVGELERELGWRRPSHRTTTMRFDCKLHILMDRFRILYQGFSEKEAIFSMLVRKNVLTREEALAEAQREIAEEELLAEGVIEEIARTIGAESRISKIKRLFQVSKARP